MWDRMENIESDYLPEGRIKQTFWKEVIRLLMLNIPKVQIKRQRVW